MSKFVRVTTALIRGDGVVVEAAVEGPKKAEHVVGAARGSRGGIDASRRAAAPGPPRKRALTAPRVLLRTGPTRIEGRVGGP